MIQFPVAVASLTQSLPHRPPMIWIDEVLAADQHGGVCALTLDASALYGGEAGRYLTFAPVEWLAQAYGYARACYEVMRGSPSRGARRTFLVGVTELELASMVPTSGRLIITVRLTRELPPLALVDGTVRSEAGVQLAAGRLKLYFES